jgi:hypothetical protein
MNLNDISIIKDNNIDNNGDKKRVSRERKAPLWRTDDIISDYKAMNESIREYQRGKPKKKKTNSNNSLISNPLNENAVVKNSKSNSKKSSDDAIIITTTMSTIPKAPLSNKDKEEEKLLERIMNNAAIANETQKQSLLPVHLPIKKPSFGLSLESAILRSVDECTALINDWSTAPAQLIGRLCKVYWEDEFTWYYLSIHLSIYVIIYRIIYRIIYLIIYIIITSLFIYRFYARIINYDSKFNRHYIYYALDNTAEWINLQDDCVIVCDSLCMAKQSDKKVYGWPAMHFWMSEKARQFMMLSQGKVYEKADYVEYFDGLVDCREKRSFGIYVSIYLCIYVYLILSIYHRSCSS